MKRIFFYILICMVLAGCKTTLPVVTPPDVHSHESDRVRTEFIHDTVTIDRLREIVRRGDTVYIHDTTTITDIRREKVRDSIYVNNTDTIYQPVERQFTDQEQFYMKSGKALWWIIGLLLAGVLIGIVIKFAK